MVPERSWTAETGRIVGHKRMCGIDQLSLRASQDAERSFCLCLFALPLSRLFSRLVLEAPRITPNALDIIKGYCKEEVTFMLDTPTINTTATCDLSCTDCMYMLYAKLAVGFGLWEAV